MTDEPAPSGDRRLQVVEAECVRVLKVAGRDHATVSPILRDSWDTGMLRITTRREPLKADGAHISLIGHITTDELRSTATWLDAASGLLNRILFVMAKRSKLLPSGGGLREDDRRCRAVEIRDALTAARKIGLMRRDAEAEERWASLCAEMAEDDPGGLVGAITARAEAQTLRLSVTYALLDGSRTITVDHLEAAYAVWQYCRDSAAYIFGDTTGDETADALFAGLIAAGPDVGGVRRVKSLQPSHGEPHLEH